MTGPMCHVSLGSTGGRKGNQDFPYESCKVVFCINDIQNIKGNIQFLQGKIYFLKIIKQTVEVLGMNTEEEKNAKKNFKIIVVILP